MNTPFDPYKIRRDFPILAREVHGKPLIYLDNAATTQKPNKVIDVVSNFYRTINSNVHRGVHALSEQATHAYEDTREKVQHFIHAKESREIIFVRGTTEAINLVTQSYGRNRLTTGDEIIISAMEHHSNIVPWQLLCEQTGALLRVVPITDAGELILEEYEKLLNPKTKLVSIAHISNSLGTINPVKKIIELAHRTGAVVLVDGAQAAAHLKIDVQALDCDFYAFSSHKMFGPTGVGVLYGKAQLLENMPPYQGGGEMITQVTFQKTTYREIPHRFEAGTPNIADTIGLGAAIDYLNELNFKTRYAHEEQLLHYAAEKICTVPGLRLIGTAREKAAILSFVFDHVHAHDVGTILDYEGIAVRTGHHCTMPLMERLHVPATVRASFAFYNTQEDVDALLTGLYKVNEVFHNV